MTVGDLDGDGDPDILETEEHGTRIYWNEGHCDFRPWLSLPATVPHLIDIDRDDDLDLIVRRDSGLVAILNQPVKLSPSDGANPVELPDGQLRRVIATTLDKSEDMPVYVEELEQLKRLDCSHRAWGPFSLPIEDFSGLEFATGLKVLDLSGSWNPGFRVTGLSTLKRWPELDILKLDNNFLHGFALTKELTSLKELHLTNNRLTELLLPNGIDSLQALYLAENDIRELTLPPTLTDLRFIDVNGNRLRNLELSSLHTKVEQILANDNQIEALALPSSLTTLIRLDLAGNKLQSIAVPQEWNQLSHLDLQRNPLSEVVTPTKYSSLRSLALSGSLATSGLSFLANLPALEDLTLTESSLELSGINPLPHLKHLKATESRLASLSLPVGYQNLETLKISGDMTSLELPSDLSQLREIEIRETKLTQLNLPPGLHSLEEFTATKNQIRRIEFSSDARQLRTLNLTWNNTLEGLRLPEGVGADAQGPHEIQFFGTQTERLELPTYWPHPQLYTSALINASSFKVNPDGQVELEILGSYGLIQLERSVDLKSWTPVETVENQGEPYSFRILDTSAPDSPQVFYRVQHLRF